MFYTQIKGLPELNRLSKIGREDQPDNPSLSGLNLEFNRIKVWNRKKTIPPLEHLHLFKGDLSKRKGLKFSYKKNTFENWHYFEQKSYKKIEEIPIRNSSHYTAYTFKYFLDQLDIETPSPQKLLPQKKISA